MSVARRGAGPVTGMPTGPTMPSDPAERYPHPDCTSDKAPAGDVVSGSGPGGGRVHRGNSCRRVLSPKVQSAYGYPAASFSYLGRRRVILAGLAMAAAACGLFLAARGVGLLFAARALHGAAVGTSSSALGAALIDLQPEGRGRAPVVTTAASLLGLAAGGLGTSALVQDGPAPTHLVWWLLLGAFLAAAAAVLAMAETAQARPGVLATLRPRVTVPRQARGTFVMALPCLVAVWMISGFYLALGPSLAAQVLRSPDLLWGRAGDLPARRDRRRGVVRVPPRQRARGHAGRLPGPARRRRRDPRRDPGHVGGGLPRRHRGRRRRLRYRHAGRLPHHQRPGRPRPARWTDRRLLHRVLRGVQYPRRGRRGGDNAFRPEPDRPGLLRGHRRTRSGGSGQPDLPQPLCRPIQRRHQAVTRGNDDRCPPSPGLHRRHQRRRPGRAQHRRHLPPDRRAALLSPAKEKCHDIPVRPDR